MSPAAELVSLWKAEGVRLNAGAAPAELYGFGKLLGVELAGDLLALYALADGMVDLEYDARQASVWSIAKIQTHASKFPLSPPAFADFLIESWHFRLGQGSTGLVVLSDNVRSGAPPKQIGSFSEFLRMYIANPRGLDLFDPSQQ